MGGAVSGWLPQPAFLRQLEDLLAFIDEQFSETARWEVGHELANTCTPLGRFSALGKTEHNCPTSLAGFVFRVNWIFLEYDDEQVRFLHFVDGRPDKKSIAL